MKIVFFGTPEFSVPTLEILNKIPDIEIKAVVTQPDKPVGRKKTITPSPVKTTAKKLNLKVFQPKNQKELSKVLKNIDADFFVVAAYGMILPKEVLNKPKFGSINIHASLLPKYRGASPIQESLLHGDKETGISILKMDKKLDHGPIYMIKKIKIEYENLDSLTEKLAILGSQLLPIALEDIAYENLSPIPQNDKKATYCKKISKNDGKIDWKKSAEEINNMIKAYTPWPSAFTNFHGKNLKILEAETESKSSPSPPGTFFLDNNTLKISTKKGLLIPKKVQIEGKKEMDIKTFVNGYKKYFS